ncbi:MAG: hypothetical protein RL153_1558 [Verrucomicrobiota bacterium]
MNEPASARALLRSAAQRLAAAGVESAELDVGLLLEHATGIPRLRRMALGDDAVAADAARRFEDAVTRRAARAPLQHIVGRASFLGLELDVDGRVLVPRPETEQLVLQASACIAGRTTPRILDLGTGSGCIALALARLHPGAEVVAMDVSEAALAVARGNARINGLDGRVRWLRGDAFGSEGWAGTGLGSLDLVVSNPPYIPSGDIATLEPEVREHDPRLALDGGEDGLGPYRSLAAHAWKGLAAGGWLALEFGDGQGEALLSLLGGGPWEGARLGKDLSGRDRVLIVRGSRG